MARKSIEQRLVEVENERKTLKARLGKQERARDTRRKVLLGALVLHKLEANTDEEMARRLRDWLRRELPGFLQRDIDKALFEDLLGQTAKTAIYDGSSEPDEQAEPDETAMPARSRLNKIDSPSIYSNEKSALLGKRLLPSLGPLSLT